MGKQVTQATSTAACQGSRAIHGVAKSLSLCFLLLAAACGDGSDGSNAHELGGSVSGLSGSGLVIANGTDTLALSPGATSFTMPAKVGAGSTYALSVRTQPSGQTCSFAQASGTMPDAAMRNAVLTCAAQSYTVGGSVVGLTTTGLVLANGSDQRAVSANATAFAMGGQVAQGGTYAVTVVAQPAGQVCAVSAGSGQMGSANVINVQVTCTSAAFTIGGSITGLSAQGLVLANATDELAVAANATSFTMGSAVVHGGAYAITVKTQPAGLACSVVNGSGTINAAHVTSVAVTCAVNSYTVGGTISGLTVPGLVLANGADELALAANATTFTMNNPVANGGGYAVTVRSQPAGRTCTVANGTGSVNASNVGNVTVTCAVSSYTLGGSIANLTTAGLVLANGGDELTVAANATGFTMTQPVAHGSSYAVTVKTQPASLLCTVASGTGTMTGPVETVTVSCTPQATVSTLAGSVAGDADGTGNSALFNRPRGVAVDSQGNLYVADADNNRVRKITPAGVVSTLAGSTYGMNDGSGVAAQFANPLDVAVDTQGNVYVADSDNNRIRKIAPNGDVSTLAGSATSGSADGLGAAAEFAYPTGVAVDGQGLVYVVDADNHRIRKITPAGDVSTLAGSDEGDVDADGAAAKFSFPVDLSLDAQGNVYVADAGNHKVRKITPTGTVSTLAGSSFGYADGAGTAAKFALPNDVAVDAQGNVYVADADNNRIRKITPAGLVSTLAGSTAGYADGSSVTAKFDFPDGIAVDAQGRLYVSDSNNHRIRKIVP